MNQRIKYDRWPFRLRALHKVDTKYGIGLEVDGGGHLFNWLDAASLKELYAITNRLLLASAQRMAYRSCDLLETAFLAYGYTDETDSVVECDENSLILKSFYDMNALFYQKVKRRLTEIQYFEKLSGKHGTETSYSDKDFLTYRQFEWDRRHNIVKGSGMFRRWQKSSDDFCPVDMDELNVSMDAINFIVASRMAIRSSIRLEQAWVNEFDPNNGPAGFEVRKLDSYVAERNGYVDSYLEIREEQAKAAYNQSRIDRIKQSTAPRTELMNHAE